MTPEEELVKKEVTKNLKQALLKARGILSDEEVSTLVDESVCAAVLEEPDNSMEALIKLFQKGSLSIEYILELFNIDCEEARKNTEQGLFPTMRTAEHVE